MRQGGGARRATCKACAATCAKSAPFEPAEDDYLVYTFNRFQACRFGLDGEIVDPKTKQRSKLRDDIIRTLARIEPHALDLQALDALQPDRESLPTATTRAGCANAAPPAIRCER